jgi:5-methylcytosine-specific restriction protein A
METHHLIPLKVQDDFMYSLDVPANIISLYPNCHREVHLGNPNKILELLLENHKDELEKYSINVDLEGLKSIYTL